jgi:hypothetical protein
MDPHQPAATANAVDLGGSSTVCRARGHAHHGRAQPPPDRHFNGHHIVITTTYETTVDGKPLAVHIA